MTMNELILLGKNLVVEYNKRYSKKYDIIEDRFVLNDRLTIEQVQLDRMRETSDGIYEIELSIPDDPWWIYKVIYDPNSVNKIISVIEMK